MLYKFLSSDVSQTTLVNCISGVVAYRTRTRRWPGKRMGTFSNLRSFASGVRNGLVSPEDILFANHRTVVLENRRGQSVAEIAWEEDSAGVAFIKMGDELMLGTSELFLSDYMQKLPGEFLIPTRLLYTWRITPYSITLLDEDRVEVGKLHLNSIMSDGEPLPAPNAVKGHDYFQFTGVPQSDIPELVVCCLCIKKLHQRMYYVPPLPHPLRDPVGSLRRRAAQSLVELRDAFRRTVP